MTLWSLSRFDDRFVLADRRFAFAPVFRRLESLVGMGRADAFSPAATAAVAAPINSSRDSGSSEMATCARKGSILGLDVRAMALDANGLLLLLLLPMLPRLRSSFSCNRSLEVMYINPFCDRPAFLPQLSCDRAFLTSVGDEAGDRPRSTEMLPRLCTSASLDVAEPRDDGRDELFAELRKLRKPPPLSRRLGDFCAVNGDKPLGGLAVLMTGGAAAKSSKSAVSSGNSDEEGFEKAP